MWVVLAYSKITIIKSSYVSHGRPNHPKTNTSHNSGFGFWKWLYWFSFKNTNYNKMLKHAKNLALLDLY